MSKNNPEVLVKIDLGTHLQEIIENSIDKAFEKQAEKVRIKPRNVTRAEAGERLNISLVTLDKLISKGKLITNRVGRRVYVVESSLDAYINGH